MVKQSLSCPFTDRGMGAELMPFHQLTFNYIFIFVVVVFKKVDVPRVNTES